MPTLLYDERRELISQALTCSAGEAKTLRPGIWHVRVPGPHDLWPEVALEGTWPSIAAPVGARARVAEASRLPSILELNSWLPAGLRSALHPHTRSLSLRTEIPVSENYLTGRIKAIFAGLPVAARAVLAADLSSHTGGRSETADVADPAGSELDLAGLCREAGWEAIERAGGVSVPLDVPGQAYFALVRNGRRVLAEVPLLSLDGLSERSVVAVSVLLLTASWFVCVARPGIAVDADSVRKYARFEVAFDAVPSAEELDKALQALSVACRLCGREVRALQDADIADAYLAVRNYE